MKSWLGSQWDAIFQETGAIIMLACVPSYDSFLTPMYLTWSVSLVVVYNLWVCDVD